MTGTTCSRPARKPRSDAQRLRPLHLPPLRGNATTWKEEPPFPVPNKRISSGQRNRITSAQRQRAAHPINPHLEFGPFQPAATGADGVVLAGDVHTGKSGLRWITETFRDRPVIYVLGNHEFYGHDTPALTEELGN